MKSIVVVVLCVCVCARALLPVGSVHSIIEGLLSRHGDTCFVFKYLHRQFNVYKHPAPYEAASSIPVLNSLKERTLELLKEWPDHPVLNQVLTYLPGRSLKSGRAAQRCA